MHMVDTYTACIKSSYICFDKPFSSSGGLAYKILNSLKEISHDQLLFSPFSFKTIKPYFKTIEPYFKTIEPYSKTTEPYFKTRAVF
jgi:hypothetical protein